MSDALAEVRAIDRATSSTTCSRFPSISATRSGASSRRARAVERPAARRLRHGRLGDRRRPRRRRARRPPQQAARHRARLRAAVLAPPDRAVLCSSYSGDTEETLACYEAAEALGATAIVATTGGDARRRRARATASRSSACRPGLQPRAAVGYMFTVAAEVAAPVGAGPGSGPRSTAPRRTSRRQRTRSLERAAEIAVGDRRLDPGDLRRGPHRARRLPLEDPDQRERQAARVRAEFPEARPQRDRRLGRARGDGARFSAIFLDDRDQHPRERQRFELTAKLIEPDAAARRPDRDRGRDAAPRGCCGRSCSATSSRSQLAALRGVDPIAGRGDRAPQGRARPPE